MQPSLSVPTDNIYKFSCLFGLVLIVSGLIAAVTTYTTSLDRKVAYAETVIMLESKSDRTKSEEETLSLKKRLIDVTKENEHYISSCLGVVVGFGMCLSGFGAFRWYKIIQRRDDLLAELQIQKLRAEIAKLKSETPEGSSLDGMSLAKARSGEAIEDKDNHPASEGD